MTKWETTDLEVPALPTTSPGLRLLQCSSNKRRLNLFEEITSLGIAGDMVMTICKDAKKPVPNFRVQLPPGALPTENLVGRMTPVGPRRSEIKQRLAGQGITALAFPEFEGDTRFNLRYIKSIYDILGKFQTFRNELFPSNHSR